MPTKKIAKNSPIASVAVPPGNTKEVVFAAVEKAMELADWRKYIYGDTIVLKMNAVWDKIYPCVTTSPMVVEAVIRLIREQVKPKRLIIADTDTAAMMRTDDSFRVLGIDRLAKKYGVELIGLTRTKFQVVHLAGRVINHLKISEVLLNADCIVTLPILKTHCLSRMTFALKNQWGCIHDMRHNLHTVLADALADVNVYFKGKVRFAVGDVLIAMEGNGPKTGTPVEVGYVLAGSDLVAMDAVGATIMGYDPKNVEVITKCETAKVGTKNFKIIGDKPPVIDFVKPDQKKQAVFLFEMALRHSGKWVEWLLFKTPMIYIFLLSAKIYNEIWWYLFAKQRAETMMRTRWGQMWRSYLE